jgi:hypothetical protein
MYEIIVFENHTEYDGDYVTPVHVLETFLNFVKKYINSYDFLKEETKFSWGRTYVSYSDNSGNDKPIMIMVIGNISVQMRDEFKTAIDNLYTKT